MAVLGIGTSQVGVMGFEIVIASPHREEFNDFCSKMGARTLWMPELSEAETIAIIRMGIVLGRTSFAERFILQRYQVLGGRPRQFIRSLRTVKKDLDEPLDAMTDLVETPVDADDDVNMKEEEEEQVMPTSPETDSALTPANRISKKSKWVAHVIDNIRGALILANFRVRTMSANLRAPVGSEQRELSHSLVHFEVAPHFQSATIMWLSKWVAEQVLILQREELRRSSKHYLAMLTEKQSRESVLFGELFECEFHQAICDECTFQVRRLHPPATKKASINASEDGKPSHVWTTWKWPGVAREKPSSERRHAMWLDAVNSAITPSRLQSANEFYLNPADRSFPVVDSFARLERPPEFLEDYAAHGSPLLGFQLTVAKRHAPTASAWQRLLQHIQTSKKEVLLTDIVFIVPRYNADEFGYQRLIENRENLKEDVSSYDNVRQWVAYLDFEEDPNHNVPTATSRQFTTAIPKDNKPETRARQGRARGRPRRKGR